jgi:hypothetical protein
VLAGPCGAAASALLLVVAGCATRAVDVVPAPTSMADFLGWGCTRIEDELDLVQQRATDLAYDVDERAGNNILALGAGLTLFWPALLAMRPAGPDADELARLKGRYEALKGAASLQACQPSSDELPAARAAALPVGLGEQLVYEDRRSARQPGIEWAQRVSALRRGEVEFRSEDQPASRWRQDLAGNLLAAPPGALQWPHLLRGGLRPGTVTAGDLVLSGDPQTRARMRGQVLAVGPQSVAGRHFDAAVVELFGDTQWGDVTTRVAGVLVVDRASGVLLRLELDSASPSFTLQRRLVRVDPAPPR